MDKVKLNKSQTKILDLLNLKLVHDFWPKLLEIWPQLLEITKKENIMEINKDSLDFKSGYAQAIWDILFVTETAAKGYLPTVKTIKRWATELHIEPEEVVKFGLIDWEKYKYIKDEEQL